MVTLASQVRGQVRGQRGDLPAPSGTLGSKYPIAVQAPVIYLFIYLDVFLFFCFTPQRFDCDTIQCHSDPGFPETFVIARQFRGAAATVSTEHGWMIRTECSISHQSLCVESVLTGQYILSVHKFEANTRYFLVTVFPTYGCRARTTLGETTFGSGLTPIGNAFKYPYSSICFTRVSLRSRLS